MSFYLYRWIFFKSKNNEHISVTNSIFSLIEQYTKNINKPNFYIDKFIVPENILNSVKKEINENIYLDYFYQIGSDTYRLHFTKSGICPVSRFILIGIEGDCWLRQINTNLFKIDKIKKVPIESSDCARINDPNLLLAKDEFLFRLPKGLAQYPINDSLNISGRWDLISNVNKWKKEMKEMSSKW